MSCPLKFGNLKRVVVERQRLFCGAKEEKQQKRGGQPTPRDRWLATRFGSAAVNLVAQEKWGEMVALRGNDMISVPMSDASQIKVVDPEGDMVQMARDLGIVFG